MTQTSARYGSKLLLGTASVVAIIGMWEGGKALNGGSRAYADKLASGLPTVCHGLTRHVTATPIIVGEWWPSEKCQREETAVLIRLQVQLEKCFGPVPPQSVFDAATSFAWNVGINAACRSGAMQYWQRGDWRGGCRAMVYAPGTTRPVWAYVKDGKGGYKFVQGLFNRRSAEYTFCMEDVK